MGIIALPEEIMKGFVEKIIQKQLKKKLGYDVDIQINNFSLKPKNGTMTLHADLEAGIQTKDLLGLMNTIREKD